MRFLEILYVMVCLSVQAAAVTFTPGAICDGIDMNLPVSARLSGKHLNVADIHWEPFGICKSRELFAEPGDLHHAPLGRR